jgi:tRNA pseudouridine38-40 synthase
MSTFKITLAYDGTEFVGWQRQASGTSIQGLLEEALCDLDQSDVAVIGAGRTDAGVHALGQVASFSLRRSFDCNTIVGALNARLPASVRVVAAEHVSDAFHARFHAVAKTYRYRIWNADVLSPFERCYAWHVIGRLDLDAMRKAARLIEGPHDFAAFQASGSSTRSTEREIYSSRLVLKPPAIADAGAGIETGEPALMTYEVRGNGFLRHMVRAIVGTLVEIGRGRHEIEWMSDVLAARDRTRAGPTAPPQGLVLVAVEYRPDLLAAER